MEGRKLFIVIAILIIALSAIFLIVASTLWPPTERPRANFKLLNKRWEYEFWKGDGYIRITTTVKNDGNAAGTAKIGVRASNVDGKSYRDIGYVDLKPGETKTGYWRIKIDYHDYLWDRIEEVDITLTY